jgi:hypothetical protein
MPYKKRFHRTRNEQPSQKQWSLSLEWSLNKNNPGVVYSLVSGIPIDMDAVHEEVSRCYQIGMEHSMLEQ